MATLTVSALLLFISAVISRESLEDARRPDSIRREPRHSDEHDAKRRAVEAAYQPGKAYIFDYDSRLLTGIPELNGHHYAGMSIRAKVHLKWFSEDRVGMQLSDIRHAIVNGELPIKEDRLNEKPYSYRHAFIPESLYRRIDETSPADGAALARMTIAHVDRRSGRVRELLVPAEDAKWTVNVRKSLWQLLLAPLRATDSSAEETRRRDRPILRQDEESGNEWRKKEGLEEREAAAADPAERAWRRRIEHNSVFVPQRREKRDTESSHNALEVANRLRNIREMPLAVDEAERIARSLQVHRRGPIYTQAEAEEIAERLDELSRQSALPLDEAKDIRQQLRRAYRQGGLSSNEASRMASALRRDPALPAKEAEDIARRLEDARREDRDDRELRNAVADRLRRVDKRPLRPEEATSLADLVEWLSDQERIVSTAERLGRAYQDPISPAEARELAKCVDAMKQVSASKLAKISDRLKEVERRPLERGEADELAYRLNKFRRSEGARRSLNSVVQRLRDVEYVKLSKDEDRRLAQQLEAARCMPKREASRLAQQYNEAVVHELSGEEARQLAREIEDSLAKSKSLAERIAESQARGRPLSSNEATAIADAVESWQRRDQREMDDVARRLQGKKTLSNSPYARYLARRLENCAEVEGTDRGDIRDVIARLRLADERPLNAAEVQDAKSRLERAASVRLEYARKISSKLRSNSPPPLSRGEADWIKRCLNRDPCSPAEMDETFDVVSRLRAVAEHPLERVEANDIAAYLEQAASRKPRPSVAAEETIARLARRTQRSGRIPDIRRRVAKLERRRRLRMPEEEAAEIERQLERGIVPGSSAEDRLHLPVGDQFEQTNYGICLTHYDIFHIPRSMVWDRGSKYGQVWRSSFARHEIDAKIWEIVRRRDSDVCFRRTDNSIIRPGRYACEDPANNCASTREVSSVARYIIVEGKNSARLQRVESINEFISKLGVSGAERVISGSIQILTFDSARSLDESLDDASAYRKQMRVETSLVRQPANPVARPESGQTTSSGSLRIKEHIQEVIKLLNRREYSDADRDVGANSLPGRLNLLVVSIQEQMSEEQLRNMVKAILDENKSHDREHSRARRIIIDLLAMTGTSKTVALLKALAERGDIRDDELDLIVPKVALHTKVMNGDIIRQLLDLTKLVERKARNAWPEAVLALASIVQAGCLSDQRLKMFDHSTRARDMCHPDSVVIKSDFMPYVVDKIRRPVKRGQVGAAQIVADKTAAIIALGMLSHSRVVDELAECVESPAICHMTPMQRYLSVYGLLASGRKDGRARVKYMLTNLIHNGHEETDVRVAAFNSLMRLGPSYVELQHIASLTWRDTDRQLLQVINSLFRTLSSADSRHPYDARQSALIRRVRLVYPLVRKVSLSAETLVDAEFGSSDQARYSISTATDANADLLDRRNLLSSSGATYANAIHPDLDVATSTHLSWLSGGGDGQTFWPSKLWSMWRYQESSLTSTPLEVAFQLNGANRLAAELINTLEPAIAMTSSKNVANSWLSAIAGAESGWQANKLPSVNYPFELLATAMLAERVPLYFLSASDLSQSAMLAVRSIRRTLAKSERQKLLTIVKKQVESGLDLSKQVDSIHIASPMTSTSFLSTDIGLSLILMEQDTFVASHDAKLEGRLLPRAAGLVAKYDGKLVFDNERLSLVGTVCPITNRYVVIKSTVKTTVNLPAQIEIDGDLKRQQLTIYGRPLRSGMQGAGPIEVLSRSITPLSVDGDFGNVDPRRANSHIIRSDSRNAKWKASAPTEHLGYRIDVHAESESHAPYVASILSYLRMYDYRPTSFVHILNGPSAVDKDGRPSLRHNRISVVVNPIAPTEPASIKFAGIHISGSMVVKRSMSQPAQSLSLAEPLRDEIYGKSARPASHPKGPNECQQAAKFDLDDRRVDRGVALAIDMSTSQAEGKSQLSSASRSSFEISKPAKTDMIWRIIGVDGWSGPKAKSSLKLQPRGSRARELCIRSTIDYANILRHKARDQSRPAMRPTHDFRQVLDSDPALNFNLFAGFGRNCSDYYIDMSGKSNRDSMIASEIRRETSRNPEWKTDLMSVQARRLAIKAGLMNKISMQSKTRMPGDWATYLSLLGTSIKIYGYKYLDSSLFARSSRSSDDVQSSSEDLNMRHQAVVLIQPESKTVNVELKSESPPEYKVRFTNLPLTDVVSMMVPISSVEIDPLRSRASAWIADIDATCRAEGDHVTTYDGRKINADPLRPVESVGRSSEGSKKVLLTADCSPQQSFAVRLLKSSEGQIGAVELAYGVHVFKLDSASNFYADGKPISALEDAPIVVIKRTNLVPVKIDNPSEVPNEATIASVERSADGVLELRTNLIKLVYIPPSRATRSGAIRINAAPLYRGRTCGLCGNMNGQAADDLALPDDRCLARDGAQLAEAYNIGKAASRRQPDQCLPNLVRDRARRLYPSVVYLN